MAELDDLIEEQRRDDATTRAKDVFDAIAVGYLAGDDAVAYWRDRGRVLIQIRHGTLYAYKRQGCHCARCRRANADWQRGYRRQLSLAAQDPSATRETAV